MPNDPTADNLRLATRAKAAAAVEDAARAAYRDAVTNTDSARAAADAAQGDTLARHLAILARGADAAADFAFATYCDAITYANSARIAADRQ